MAKFRRFCIVLHNVKSSSRDAIIKGFGNVKQIVASVEPYNHQEGFHCHVFVEFPNARSFNAVLDQTKNISKLVIEAPPSECDGSWGRVQVDQMRGDFPQAEKYLVNPDKDKKLGETVNIKSDERKCDKCSRVFSLNSIMHGYDYSDRKTGRCYRCKLRWDYLDNKINFDEYCRANDWFLEICWELEKKSQGDFS